MAFQVILMRRGLQKGAENIPHSQYFTWSVQLMLFSFKENLVQPFSNIENQFLLEESAILNLQF